MSPMLGSLLFAMEIVIEIEIEFSTMHIFFTIWYLIEFKWQYPGLIERPLRTSSGCGNDFRPRAGAGARLVKQILFHFVYWHNDTQKRVAAVYVFACAWLAWLQ